MFSALISATYGIPYVNVTMFTALVSAAQKISYVVVRVFIARVSAAYGIPYVSVIMFTALVSSTPRRIPYGNIRVFKSVSRSWQNQIEIPYSAGSRGG